MNINQKVKMRFRHNLMFQQMLSQYRKHRMIRRIKKSLPNSIIHDSMRFYKILERNKINVVLDIGAYDGVTGDTLRQFGYSGRIISFEPNKGVYARLQDVSRLDPLWECHPYALGDQNGTKEFKILGNKYASSFLDATDLLKFENESLQAGSGDVEREELVEVKKLDEIYSTLCKREDAVLLKIDTQGYEKQIIEGALKSLSHIRLVKMEVSFTEMYHHEIVMHEMVSFMSSLGYVPVLIEKGTMSKEMLYQLQADILFSNLRYEDNVLGAGYANDQK